MTSPSLLCIALLALRLPAASPAAVQPPAPALAPAPQVFLTVDEALELAFPDAEVKRTRAFLSAAEEERVGKLAHRKYKGRTLMHYVAHRDGKVIGTAYLDTHEVRSKKETLMIVVDPAGKVRRVEVLAFGEPREYIPIDRWYGQFPGEQLGDDLELKRGIKGVTGATLTGRATVTAVRQVLAKHKVLAERATPAAPEQSAAR